MEAVSLALGLLPLLINQLDNYVQGLQTLKGFRAKNYRRDFDGYLSELAIQKAILVNTLYWSLDGVGEYESEEEIEGTMNDHLVNLWMNPDLQTNLQRKLGRDYVPFTMTIMRLSETLDELSQKLGWKVQPPTLVSSADQSTFKKEFKKFKDIFCKSIYANLLSQIRTANSFLKDLSEQSDRRSGMQQRRISKAPLREHKKNRKSARSLHNALIHGRCWECSCRDKHLIGFALQSPWDDSFGKSYNRPTYPRFRMIFSSTMKTDQSSWDHDHEIEAESNYLEVQPNPRQASPLPNPPGVVPSVHGQRRVRFGLSPCQEDTCTQGNSTDEKASPIANICFALSTLARPGPERDFLGYLPDEDHRHNLYRVRSLTQDLKFQSLEQMLSSASQVSTPNLANGFLFSQRHRLRLAASLACSVLELHGSWLREHWRARDIKIYTEESASLDSPYISWNASGEVNPSHICQERNGTALVRNEILFPLGLVLVELSLCHSLESLRTQDDMDTVESNVHLKTASRLIPNVAMQSGIDYSRVVDRCLFWPGTKGCTMDNETMQDEVFQEIVLPLVENLRRFEGTR